MQIGYIVRVYMPPSYHDHTFHSLTYASLVSDDVWKACKTAHPTHVVCYWTDSWFPLPMRYPNYRLVSSFMSVRTFFFQRKITMKLDEIIQTPIFVFAHVVSIHYFVFHSCSSKYFFKRKVFDRFDLLAKHCRGMDRGHVFIDLPRFLLANKPAILRLISLKGSKLSKREVQPINVEIV